MKLKKMKYKSLLVLLIILLLGCIPETSVAAQDGGIGKSSVQSLNSNKKQETELETEDSTVVLEDDENGIDETTSAVMSDDQTSDEESHGDESSADEPANDGMSENADSNESSDDFLLEIEGIEEIVTDGLASVNPAYSDIFSEEDLATGESGEIITEGSAYVNPIYEDVISEDDITIPEIEPSSQSGENNGINAASDEDDETGIVYSDTVEEAAALLRAGMKERESTIVIYYYGEVYSSDYFTELCTEYLIPEALAETVNADEGDYIRYNYGGTGYRASITADSNGEYRYYTITFTPTYFTTAEQEAAVNTEVEALLADDFAFSEDASDFDQLYAVYDYICSNVTYDNDNLSDSTYTLKYTAYAALINKTAVCQGYATLYYRFLRELGFGVRVATGYGGLVSEDTTNYYENHAWNIVSIDGNWYYADATWDAKFSGEVAAGTYTYQYFLRGTSDFDDLASPYTTTGIHVLIMDTTFTNTYPVQETRYHNYVAVVTEPTCTEGGYTTYTCSLCGDSYTADETEAAGHSWDDGIVTETAADSESGVGTILYTCTVCGETKTVTGGAPSVSLSVSQNDSKIRLTGTVADYEHSEAYYTITGHGFVYITKAVLGAKSLSVNTSGRTKVTVTGFGSTGAYSYSMSPKTESTFYVIRAWITYKNAAGNTI